MIRSFKIVMVLLFFLSCNQTKKTTEKRKPQHQKEIDQLEPDLDTLPNGKRLFDNMDSGMVTYYKQVVGSDTLKGGYISCYGIDDSSKYFYLRKGDTLHLLKQVPINTSSWSLGTFEQDFDGLMLTRIEHGNGVTVTYQLFDKQTGGNILGDQLEAWAYQTYSDSLFFLYDNHTVTVIGNNVQRKIADSIFLYNATSGRRQGVDWPKVIPEDVELDLKKITKNNFTISWVKIMTNDDEKQLSFRR